MVNITNDTLEGWLKEDVPYFDLTTYVLGIDSQDAEMQIFCREDAVICGTEELERLCTLKGVSVVEYIPSGEKVSKDQVVITMTGRAATLHMFWKTCQNILEYASAVATRTDKLLQKARKINEHIAIVSTRKVFPGTKELSIKAVLCGGGLPHRLGLSETILIFQQHRNFWGTQDEFIAQIKKIKSQISEKKIVAEIEQPEDALAFCKAGIGGLQFDKMNPDTLSVLVQEIKNSFPHVTTIATGGINEDNIEIFAATGVDAIVTTSMYFGKPVNIGVRIKPRKAVLLVNTF
jgi:molybdenum transport protein